MQFRAEQVPSVILKQILEEQVQFFREELKGDPNMAFIIPVWEYALGTIPQLWGDSVRFEIEDTLDGILAGEVPSNYRKELVACVGAGHACGQRLKPNVFN